MPYLQIVDAHVWKDTRDIQPALQEAGGNRADMRSASEHDSGPAETKSQQIGVTR